MCGVSQGISVNGQQLTGSMMGGFGSGRVGWRPTVEGTAALVLGAEALVRPVKQALRERGLGAIPEGRWLEVPASRWSWSRDGASWAEVEFALRLGARTGEARLRYDIDHLSRPTGRQDYSVTLVATPCRFGGLRWWWLCPATGRRVAKLYLPNGGQWFLSRGRGAYPLVYASQSEDRIGRAHRRAARIHRRLGGEARAACAPPPQKPKGMRWRTYERLVAELDRARAALDEACLAGAARLLARCKG
jgi:hypothetical protein